MCRSCVLPRVWNFNFMRAALFSILSKGHLKVFIGKLVKGHQDQGQQIPWPPGLVPIMPMGDFGTLGGSRLTR